MDNTIHSQGPIRFENRDAVNQFVEASQTDRVYIKEKTVDGKKQWKIAVETGGLGGKIQAVKQAARQRFSGKTEPIKYDSLSNVLVQYLRGDASELFEKKEFKEFIKEVPVDRIPNTIFLGSVDEKKIIERYKGLPFEKREQLLDKFTPGLKERALNSEMEGYERLPFDQRLRLFEKLTPSLMKMAIDIETVEEGRLKTAQDEAQTAYNYYKDNPRVLHRGADFTNQLVFAVDSVVKHRVYFNNIKFIYNKNN